MYSVVRPANGAVASSLRLMMVLMVASVLVLSTGCSWFGKKKPVEAPQAPATYAAPAAQAETPANAPQEGHRPGDLAPFPELQVIYYDFDKPTPRKDQVSKLEGNLKYLQAHPEDKVLITGNCDERGTSEYNMSLGEKRAKAVQEYYLKGGIDANRIAILSKGEEEPVALGHDEASWSKNRRAEFQRMY